MKGHYLDNIKVNILKAMKRLIYKLFIGEIFITQYKKDSRSQIAKLIDSFIPVFIVNSFLFLIFFSNLNSIFISLILCILLTVLFYKSLKMLKFVTSHYLQGMYELKEKVNHIYSFIINLDEKELENYSYELMGKIKTSKLAELGNFNHLNENLKVKVIHGNHENKDELIIVTNFKNELLTSNNHFGIIILNYPTNKELLKLVNNYSSKSIVNLLIVDLYGLINLAITHHENVEADKNNDEDKLQIINSLNSFNQQLLIHKKKVLSHISVALLLFIIGLILESFGSIYMILSFVNIILAFISLCKYLDIINVLIPGNIDSKILNTIQS